MWSHVTTDSGMSSSNLADGLVWALVLKQEVVWGMKDIEHNK